MPQSSHSAVNARRIHAVCWVSQMGEADESGQQRMTQTECVPPVHGGTGTADRGVRCACGV